MAKSTFYIGRALENQASGQSLQYNPDDLTTHAVIVGMTGSGKTGLLVSLLEEAALSGLPAIVIDPKGDLTNLLLHFPELRPGDFEPWIDPEAARRAGLNMPQLAAQTAQKWSQGLASWNMDRQQLEALQNAVDYVVYTPGSTAGEPVNLLASFVPPAGLNWEEHREVLRERIASTATALLGLVGLKDIDPLRSREHILISNLIEGAWTSGKPLDLSELIMQVQNPPFERLGAFPINSFFPEKDRFNLALLLNNFLASPSFQTWIDGQPLDMEDFMVTPTGKPRMSIFYLAHLDETERMFFVTLLLAALESWMRAQRGSPGLRALLAFDEITGDLPPIANPPSRPVLLRLLKQARAFGLGLLLATQNPVDLDYKGLSNAGTWFVGRLQTEQDRDRLLDGLQSIEGSMDRAGAAKVISALKPRNFLLHNIHDSAGQLIFETRWCLNYLAGPLTRAQLGGLKALGSAPDEPPQPSDIAGAIQTPDAIYAVPPTRQASVAAIPPVPAAPPTRVPPVASSQPASPGQNGLSRTPPAAPVGMQVLFASPELSISQALARLGGSLAGPVQPLGMVYRPGLFFQAEVRFNNRRYALDSTVPHAALVSEAPGARIEWESCARDPLDARRLDTQPLPEARFQPLPGWLSTVKVLNTAQKDFIDWILRSSTVRLFANEELKLYSEPDESRASFRQKCDEAARRELKDALDKVDDSFSLKLSSLARKVEKQESIVDKYENNLDRRRMEEVGTNFELVFSIFTRRKRSISYALSKGRMTAQARAELEAADEALDGLQDEYKSLQDQKAAAERDVQEEWARAVSAISEIPLTPLRKDVYVEIAALVWMPVYQLQAEGQVFFAPAC